jgi:hypothetical protein
MIRPSAPVFCIRVIWKIEVATTRAIGREAMTPDSDARSMTGHPVRNASHASSAAKTQPKRPVMSAGLRNTTRMRKMTTIGETASRTII